MNHILPPLGGETAALSQDSVRRLSRLIHEQARITLQPDKTSMISARLAKRLRATGIRTVEEYLDHVTGPRGAEEIDNLVSALTTNFTHFMRESHHFDMLTKTVLPPLAAQNIRPIRIWSAGCSTGQEPLSIAISILEHSPGTLQRCDILASDIDQAAVQKARSGQYTEKEFPNMRIGDFSRHFTRDGNGFRASAQITSAIRYEQRNLFGIWPHEAPFDAIFCRNVAIYFSHADQEELWRRLHRVLKPDGWLFIGHSERIPHSLNDLLLPQGGTAFRKRA